MIDYNNTFVEEMWNLQGFESLNSLVDVGGGNGSILHRIVSKYPAIKGTNFDLSQIIEKSPSYPGMIIKQVTNSYICIEQIMFGLGLNLLSFPLNSSLENT